MTSPRRKPLLVATLLILVCLAVEVLSYLGFFAVTRRAFTWDRLNKQKQRQVEAAAAVRADAAAATTMIVPHPYLGFVYSPDYDPVGMANLHGVPVSDWGFLDDKLPLQPAAPGDVVIGIFGGSVAFYFSVQGVPALLEELAQVPAFRGKRLVVVRTALGGFKQPQQLLTLNYLLSMGGHFDLVINLDGFNEVGISPHSLSPEGIFPFFPRDWGSLVGGPADLSRLRLVGEITHLQKLRGERAALFLKPGLRHSIFTNLLWKLLDRRLFYEIKDKQVALSRYQPEAGTTLPFAVRGPRRPHGSSQALFEDIAGVWKQSSLQMAQVSRANGARYFHFLQPNQYLEGSKPIGEEEREVAFLPPGNPFETGVDTGYPLLKAAGADLARAGLSFHDLSLAFAGVDKPLYIDNCCHFNVEGNALLGKKMGEIIRRELTAAP